MARPRILDEKLLDKIGKKLKKTKGNKINIMVSHKASSLGISSEAALVLIAKELDIGTSTYQRKLDIQKQAEIRDALPSVFTKKNKNVIVSNPINRKNKVETMVSGRSMIKAAVEYLIADQQLQERCADLLLARTHFDRPINQATLILEDRIRTKTTPKDRLEGVKLVNYAFNADLSKTILQVGNSPEEQDGFTNILRGVVLAFRNPTHHHLIDTFSREQALKVCGLVDVLLKIIDNSKKIK